jgi:hypothetical protein
MIFALVLMATTPAPFLGDAYAICGKDPKVECLQWADQCLRQAYKQTPNQDEAFEWCAEEIPPVLVNLTDGPDPSTWPTITIPIGGRK